MTVVVRLKDGREEEEVARWRDGNGSALVPSGWLPAGAWGRWRLERVTSGGFAEVACRSRGEKKESGNAVVQMK